MCDPVTLIASASAAVPPDHPDERSAPKCPDWRAAPVRLLRESRVELGEVGWGGWHSEGAAVRVREGGCDWLRDDQLGGASVCLSVCRSQEGRVEESHPVWRCQTCGAANTSKSIRGAIGSPIRLKSFCCCGRNMFSLVRICWNNALHYYRDMYL